MERFYPAFTFLTHPGEKGMNEGFAQKTMKIGK
jgi:hypothetical protein